MVRNVRLIALISLTALGAGCSQLREEQVDSTPRFGDRGYARHSPAWAGATPFTPPDTCCACGAKLHARHCATCGGNSSMTMGTAAPLDPQPAAPIHLAAKPATDSAVEPYGPRIFSYHEDGPDPQTPVVEKSKRKRK